jgi:hypothetical protein
MTIFSYKTEFQKSKYILQVEPERYEFIGQLCKYHI